MLKSLSPLLGFALCLIFSDPSLPEAETPQMGQKIYSLERAKSAELSIIVPSTWMTWIEKGQALDFTIDATKESFDAKIVRLGVSVDPVSQTYEIIAKPAHSPKALMGMSGVARFKDAP